MNEEYVQDDAPKDREIGICPKCDCLVSLSNGVCPKCRKYVGKNMNL